MWLQTLVVISGMLKETVIAYMGAKESVNVLQAILQLALVKVKGAPTRGFKSNWHLLLLSLPFLYKLAQVLLC